MVGVGEEDCREQGEWFKDVELDDWNADMAEHDVEKICQANRKCGPEKDLYSSCGWSEKGSGVEIGSMTTERTSLALRTDALRVVNVCMWPKASDLIPQRRKRETTRRATRRVERTIPSSKHGVKSNTLSFETGPHASW
jgi:hypothetical protein